MEKVVYVKGKHSYSAGISLQETEEDIGWACCTDQKDVFGKHGANIKQHGMIKSGD